VASVGPRSPFSAVNFFQGVVSVEQSLNLRRSNLTPREREVVRMIAEGNSARKIAGTLGLSVKTVEAHKFNLMRKLDIHNKAQLVTYAIQKRIVALPAEA
jgi:DNA-binding NarL/FixJ family response regulator